jgi:hypothetical protein
MRNSEEAQHERRASSYSNVYTNRLEQCLFHPCGSLISHVGEHVGVGIQGSGYGGMTEHLRDYLGFTFFEAHPPEKPTSENTPSTHSDE